MQLQGMLLLLMGLISSRMKGKGMQQQQQVQVLANTREGTTKRERRAALCCAWQCHQTAAQSQQQLRASRSCRY
jgi:hypothetical protein